MDWGSFRTVQGTDLGMAARFHPFRRDLRMQAALHLLHTTLLPQLLRPAPHPNPTALRAVSLPLKVDAQLRLVLAQEVGLGRLLPILLGAGTLHSGRPARSACLALAGQRSFSSGGTHPALCRPELAAGPYNARMHHPGRYACVSAATGDQQLLMLVTSTHLVAALPAAAAKAVGLAEPLLLFHVVCKDAPVAVAAGLGVPAQLVRFLRGRAGEAGGRQAVGELPCHRCMRVRAAAAGGGCVSVARYRLLALVVAK